MELGRLLVTALGLLLVAGGLGLILLQLRRGSPASPLPTPTPPQPASTPQPQPAALTESLPAYTTLSTEQERRERLQQLRSQPATTPVAVPPQAGAGDSYNQPLGPPVQRRGGRPPRQTVDWRNSVAGYTVGQSAVNMRPIITGTIILLLLLLVAGLISQLHFGGRPGPGSAKLVIADFGESADFTSTELGKKTAQTVMREVQAGLGGDAAKSRMPVVSAGIVRSAAEAAQELDRQDAQALLWGELPAGGGGTISATLTWRGSAPPAPWLRFGTMGRLLLPAQVPLPGQPLIAVKALAPALEAVELYEAGDYDAARARAEGMPQDAPASTQNLAAFIRANSLVATGQPELAVALYRALEARGWTDPAIYNNWGVAATMLKDYGQALDRLGRGAAVVPAPPPSQLATILTNQGIAAEESGDFAGAHASYDAALRSDPANEEANLRRGYLAYREGDGQTASTYTSRARAGAGGDVNPYIERQAGLISLMQLQSQGALGEFQKALDIYNGWDAALRADEGAQQSRDATGTAARIAQQILDLNQERGTTEYYIGLAHADLAKHESPPGFLGTIWNGITNHKTQADQAIAAFNEAIRLDRDRPDVRTQMGVLYKQQGNRTAAREQFGLAIKLQPADPGPYEALATMDIEDKDTNGALAEYQALIRQNPGYLPAYLKMGEIYKQLGDTANQQRVFGLIAAQPANTPAEHLTRAQALAALGRNDEALNEANAAYTGDPTLIDAHLLAAQIYVQANQKDAALGEYEAALKQQPKNAAALYAAGEILAAQGRTTDAAKLWQQVERVQPDHPQVHFALAGLYEQQASEARQAGNSPQANRLTDQAMAEYSTAVSRKTGTAEAYYHLALLNEQKGKLSDAEQHYGDAVKQDPNLVEGWVGLVRVQLAQANRTTEALQSAQAFHQRAPNDVRSSLLLGEVFLARDDPSAALGQYQQALKLAPGDPQALYGTGQAYQQMGDSDHAGQYYRAALQAQPGNPQALTGLGDLYLDGGNTGQAQGQYDAALQSDPNYAPAYVGRGRALDKLSVSNPNLGDKAVEALKHAAALDPASADPQFYLGEIYSERGAWDTAIGYYNAAAHLRPSWAMPEFRLGQAYLSEKKPPEAIAAYQQAVKLDPHMLEAWFGLGQAERDTGNRKEAIDAYQHAISLKSDYAAAWLYLGYTYADDGQRDQAVNSFQHAAASATDDPEVRNAAQDALRRYQ
ncbi:MAG: tetratricopeptide repeat protein [Chloroflexia bacterium]